MSLHFFCDQCVPSEITDFLKRGGHEVTLLREVLPIRSVDSEVIAKARELKVILLSLNGDFADIVATRRRPTLASWPFSCATARRSFLR